MGRVPLSQPTPAEPSSSRSALDPEPYDALVLVSFGGPEQAADVVPFLRNVTQGKDIPDARLEEVGAHYYANGGRSPINDQNRAFLAAIREDLASNGIDHHSGVLSKPSRSTGATATGTPT